MGIAEAEPVHVDVVAQGFQLGLDIRWDARLDAEEVRDNEAKAWGAHGLLDVHAEGFHVRDHLSSGLRYGATAGGAERDHGSTVARDYHGTERVQRLASCVDIEDVALGLEATPGELVVEPQPRPLGHELAPEDVAQGLRRRDDVALPV